MANTWTLGRTGLVYVSEESAYGTAPTHLATNALRHLNVSLPFNPRNRQDSPARYADPSLRNRFTRRQTASFDLTALLYPSGTIGTAPEAGVLLKNGLGAAATSTASTTVSASPAPTTTGCTVASPTGITVGAFVTITIAAGPSAGTYMRFVTAVNTAAITWVPALPAAPASGDTVKGGVTYSLATALPKSLDVAHYADNQNREQLGCVVDRLTITFDQSQEPRIQASGPAQGYTTSAQAKPGSFTTVGSDSGIPSGITGALYVGDIALEFLKFSVELQNSMKLQDTAFGTSKPVTYYRDSRRVVNVSVDTMVSDQVTLYTAARATSSQAIFAQCGLTEGYQVAIYLPQTEWDVPDTPDNDGTNQWAFKGRALAAAANGEMYIGFC